MSKIVFILGAGASAGAGVPVMKNFIEVATNLFQSGKVDRREKEFTSVLSAIGVLQGFHSKAQFDNNNIESIFNAFEMGRMLGTFYDFSKPGIERIINSLKWLIVATIEESMQFKAIDKSIFPVNGYENFSRQLSSIRLKYGKKADFSLITFNYDIGLDVALANVDLVPNYYLSDNENGNCTLLKLHGSLNWATNKNHIVPLHMRDYLADKVHKMKFVGDPIKLKVASELKNIMRDNDEENVKELPVIIPPSWNKTDYHGSIQRVWGRAGKELSNAEYIVIIGYSMPETDLYFKLLYTLGTFGSKKIRRFDVINPDGSIEEKFQDLIGPGVKDGFRFIKSNFDSLELPLLDDLKHLS
jgi:hypothetical protein